MEFKRFKDIILKNRNYAENVKHSLKNFHDRVRWDGDIPKIMKEIGKKLDVLIIELPMNDSEFGAVYLETGYSKYLLLNSNQPRNLMYFSFCHDIYHILNGTPEYINIKREVHFNQEYTLNENESKANLFAANLLMPELEFKRMFELYKEDSKSNDEIVAKLMNYFSSPFGAVLIRLYELDIFKDIKEVKGLLEYGNEEIEKLFDIFWLDKEILKPTLKDEMSFVLEMLKTEGTELIQMQLISEYNFNNIIEKINKLYFKIKLEK